MAVRCNHVIFLVINIVILFGDTRAVFIANEKSYDTIVIGLGSAGTTAASTLARAGRRVLALEAQGRVGGRVKTVPFGDGVVEEGAEWIQGTHPSRAYDLAIQNNITLKEQDLDFYTFQPDGSRVNDSIVKDLLAFGLNKLDSPTEVAESVGQFITKSLMEYINQKYPDLPKVTEFLQDLLQTLNVLISDSIACNDWNDVNAHSKYKDIDGHQSVSWHRQGYKTFFELLLNKFDNGPGLPSLDIKLNKEVTLIKWPRNSTGPIQVTCRDGDHYTASNVIVTVSLGVLKERYSTLFQPSLPEDKITVINKMSMGVIGKIVLSFPVAWWPNKTALVFFWTKEEIDQLGTDEKWVSNIYLSSFPQGSSNTMTLWVSGDVAKLVETLPEDVVKRKCIEVLRKFVGRNYNIPEPTGMIRSKWFSNPYTRGTYSFDNLLMEQYPNARATLAEPLVDGAGSPKVLFAGEATDSVHYATVHGASDSGYKEAMRLLNSGTL